MKCILCGKEFDGKDFKVAPVCSYHCAHTLEFWLELQADMDLNADRRIIIIKNRCYRLRAEDETTAGFRGFSGARFYIRFNDGTEITTTNLWSLGVIPEFFRNELPDNATFITPVANKKYITIYKGGKKLWVKE